MRTRRPPHLVVAVALVGALVAGAVALLDVRAGEHRLPDLRPVAERALRASRPEVRAAHLLQAWDTRRAAAWSAQDPAALGRLYRPGSSAGRRDQAMMQTWQRRGLHVEDLRTQVVRLRVLSHRPGRYELDVVDRLVGGTAVGPAGRHELPRDAPSTRRVVLVEEPGGWVVASVSAARS